MRFIPACAGNALLGPFPAVLGAVHPRMRGERPAALLPWLAWAGSSPHARGTLLGLGGGLGYCRFIPACAGNAPLARSVAPGGPVHPRMRGERVSGEIGRPSWPGSSPHARGTLRRAGRRRVRRRFIPACAGNACISLASRTSRSVHPRMRGERESVEPNSRRPSGSSPHARGTRANMRPCRSMSRLIPACAGNAAQ